MKYGTYIIALFGAVIVIIALGSPVVARNAKRSRLWWNLNRFRSAMAYEGDPGPWRGIDAKGGGE